MALIVAKDLVFDTDKRHFYNETMKFLEKFAADFGPELAKQLGQALSLPPTHGLFLNPAFLPPKVFSEAFPDCVQSEYNRFGFAYDKDKHEFGKILAFDLGAYYIQDPSAMLVSTFLNPSFGACVLDMCAAPGGKSIGLATTRGDVTVIANDISYPRAIRKRRTDGLPERGRLLRRFREAPSRIRFFLPSHHPRCALLGLGHVP